MPGEKTAGASDVARTPLSSIPNARVQKKIPTFNRPSISIGAATRAAEHREWAIIPAQDITAGDIVPGIGRVFAVNEILHTPRAGSGLPPGLIADQVTWTVTITGGVANQRIYQGGETVWAYTIRKPRTKGTEGTESAEGTEGYE